MIKISDISIKTKLTVYIILIVIIVSLIISLSSYEASKTAIEKQAALLVTTSVEQIMKRTDLFLRNTHNVAVAMTYNNVFNKLLYSNQFDYTRDSDDISNFLKDTSQISNINSYYQSIYLYDLKHKIILSSRGFYSNIMNDDESYKIIKENYINQKYKGYKFLWVGRSLEIAQEISHKSTDISKSEMADSSETHVKENVASFIMPIYDINADLYGVLIINILESGLKLIYSNSGIVSSGDFYIEDSQGKIVSTLNDNLIGTKDNISEQDLIANTNSFLSEIKGRECLVTSFKSDYNNWRYISVIPMQVLMKENIKSIVNALVLISLIVICLFVMITFTFNSFFFRPVKDLINKIRLSFLKHEEISLQINRKDEIGFIFNSVNDILKENNSLIKEIYEQKISSKNSELKLLLSQINPHFLYNTLDNAISLIELDDKTEAVLIIKSLIKLFRMSLVLSNEIISVRQEVENLNSYLTIQKIKYRNDLTIDVNMDDEILDCSILKLILQPLVENSFYHGFIKKNGPWNIIVIGVKEEKSIKFFVKDNGVGISEDNILKLRRLIESDGYDNEKFYALQNINKRIKLYYGESYGVSLESKENEWTLVTLILPIIE